MNRGGTECCNGDIGDFTKNHLPIRSILKVSFYIVRCCLFLVPYQDKANTHKKLLDDAEEQFRFKEEAKDLVTLLPLLLYLVFMHAGRTCALLWRFLSA